MEVGVNILLDDEYGMSMCKVLDILGCVVFIGGINKLFDIELYLCEGNSDLIICIDC